MTAQVEQLREAAEAARQLADRATEDAPSPWKLGDENPLGSREVRDADGVCIAYSETGHNADLDATVAEHIASWDPTVARAVADLLDAGADEIARRVERHGEQILEIANPVFHAMCELARTYLGEDA